MKKFCDLELNSKLDLYFLKFLFILIINNYNNIKIFNLILHKYNVNLIIINQLNHFFIK